MVAAYCEYIESKARYEVSVALVEALVAADPDHPAHIRMTSHKEETPLMKASKEGKPHIIKILLRLYPSLDHINMNSKGGKTALAKAKNAKCADLLRAAGATK